MNGTSKDNNDNEEERENSEEEEEGGSDEQTSRKRKGGALPIQKVISQTNEQSSSSGSEVEESDESDESSSDSEIEIPSLKKKKSATSKRKKSDSDIKTSKKKQSIRSASDTYFAAQYGRRSVTSDKTLSSLKASKMDPQCLRRHIQSSCRSHANECERLLNSYVKMFDKWMFQLRNEFNCLLYGLGSKSKLIDKFRKEYLQAENHLVVNGFFPGLTIKQILNMITEDVLNYTGTFKSTTDQAVFVKTEFYSDEVAELFLLIHNIDGPMLRSSKAQAALSYLASSSKIHIFASMDHINAPLIWDQTTSSRFNWLWYDVTNFEPYLKEMSFENSFLIQQSASLALSSLIHVIRSLTPNAKGIFVLLATHQLDREDDNTYNGMAFGDLYQKCREKFLVSSDLTLRAQLTEFRDHKLIKSKKGQDGIEYLTIPIDSSSLRTFLEDETT